MTPKANLQAGIEKTSVIKTDLVACHDCDLLHRTGTPPMGYNAHCSRCGAILYHCHNGRSDRSLAFALTSLILFIVANIYPMLILELGGRIQEYTLFSGVMALFEGGMWMLALLVFALSIFFPLFNLLVITYLLTPLKLGLRPFGYSIYLFRSLLILTPWGMTGVYLLGVMVAMVKLRDLATVTPGLALYAFIGLLLTSLGGSVCLDTRTLWRRLDKKSYRVPPITPTHPTMNAHQAGLVGCHTCTLVIPRQQDSSNLDTNCLRCQTPMHPRKPDSLTRTWALILTASILYIPANLLPIMTVIRFGRGEPDTILSGVQHLIQDGMWGLALLIFFASIVVPLMKLLILSFLLISVQRHSKWRPKDRTGLYRITESFGHWSMVDIFLISILTALVKMDALTTIKPEVGATFFAAVVVLTMFAAHTFDPRLIWDAMEKKRG